MRTQNHGSARKIAYCRPFSLLRVGLISHGWPGSLRFSISTSILALCFFLTLSGVAPAEKVEQLKPTNYVNDFAGIIDANVAAQLNAMCLEVQQKTGAQIAVVTMKSLEGATKDDFANRLYKAWGIGSKKDDRGVLVLLSSGDRQYWVEVGYGLEPILPDGKVGGFGREMVPLLKANNYSAAINLITTRIAQTIAADAKATLTGVQSLPQRQLQRQANTIYGIPVSYLPWIIILIFWLISSIFRKKGSRSGPGIFWMGGGGGWGGGGFGGGGGGGFGGFGGGASGGGGAGGDW